MTTLHSTVQDHLNDTREHAVVDRQANNAYARKTTLLLFLSRLLIFRRSLASPAAARHLQVQDGPSYKCVSMCCSRRTCSIFYSTKFPSFDITLLAIFWIWSAMCTRMPKAALSSMDAYQGSRMTRGFSWFTTRHRFLEMHLLSPSKRCHCRPLLSPILHAFRDIGQHELTLVTCGIGSSISTLFWIQSSGSGLEDSSSVEGLEENVAIYLIWL